MNQSQRVSVVAALERADALSQAVIKTIEAEGNCLDTRTELEQALNNYVAWRNAANVVSLISLRDQTGFESEIRAVYDEMVAFLAEKHKTYGEENLIAFGELGVLVRTADKVSRLRHMITNNLSAATGEPRVDAWRDILGYATQALYRFRTGDFQ